MTTDSHKQNEDLIQRIGHLTRMLRVSMQELGLDREIEKAAQAIPDARDRLLYISAMTEQAANRVLSSIEKIQPMQRSLGERSKSLSEKIKLFAESESDNESTALLKEASDLLESSSDVTSETLKELLEITMAQDFQDLTGQVVKKMMEVVKEIEHQLVQVLMESSSVNQTKDEVLKRLAESEWEDEKDSSLLNGPQIKPTAGDIVRNQDQVDNLLDELGF